MAGVRDFRDFAFSRGRVENCGRFLGHRTYWKLYAIENYVRVILHSALTAQIGARWWDSSVDRNTQKAIDKLKRTYLSNTRHALPGKHDVYFLYLSDLSKILLANRHLLIKLIPDIDTLVLKLEGVRIPRNLVGHMNFPNPADRASIDDLHDRLVGLIQKLESNAGFKVQVP